MDERETKTALLKTLSPAEMKVAWWICKGLNDSQIGLTLDRQPGTINTQKTEVFKNLHLTEYAPDQRRNALIAEYKQAIFALLPDEKALNAYRPDPKKPFNKPEDLKEEPKKEEPPLDVPTQEKQIEEPKEEIPIDKLKEEEQKVEEKQIIPLEESKEKEIPIEKPRKEHKQNIEESHNRQQQTIDRPKEKTFPVQVENKFLPRMGFLIFRILLVGLVVTASVDIINRLYYPYELAYIPGCYFLVFLVGAAIWLSTKPRN